MKASIKWKRYIYVIGVIALIIGAIDPLEGSFFILAGSALIALSAYLTHDRHKNIFFFSAFLIAMGVFSLFYLSSLGGFGGKSTLSWWWGCLILPYPIGWFTIVIMLIKRLFNKSTQKLTDSND